MSNQPATPTRPSYNPTTPATSRVAAAHAVQSSPHYATTRRHSLYGVEDRVVIDPGSRIWKVGFSGEGRPRDVFYAEGQTGDCLWKLKRATDPAERTEEDRMLEVRLQKCLRSVFHDSLLTDPKARKVIVLEHPLLPLYIKEMIARILFESQVPSISFASTHLLSLFAVGRITGLVLDCGHLESIALPIFAARPLFPQLRTTPLAGARLTFHIRALLLLYGTYLPPPTSLSAAANIPASTRSTRVPLEVLTDAVIEDIKTRCCFVGDILGPSADTRGGTPVPGDEMSDMDLPPPSSEASQTHSESDFSHAGLESAPSRRGGGTVASSEFSIVSGVPGSSSHPVAESSRSQEGHLQALAAMYTRSSTATELKIKVVPPLAQQVGTGRGTLIIPGWIRERAAEVLFEGGDVDESSVAEVILDTLLKVPVDLRRTLVSSILVIGGTAMLPGFIPRLHAELLHTIASAPTPAIRPALGPGRVPPPPYDKYASLRPLVPYLAILNNPNPGTATTERANANAGKAPAFSPATMAWVGGSLAGSLKTGGAEVAREKWDEATANREALEDSQAMDTSEDAATAAAVAARGGARDVLPDWTKSPLPTGAPPAAMVKANEVHVGA